MKIIKRVSIFLFVLNVTLTYANDEEWKFKKEIVVTDPSGRNSISLAIHSEDEDLLKEYLEKHSFTLSISEEENAAVEVKKFDGVSSINEEIAAVEVKKVDGVSSIDKVQEPKVIVELTGTDLKPDTAGFSLNVNGVSNFIFGYPVGYYTETNFIGAVHLGWGYEFLAKLVYKTHWYSLSWKYLEDNNGVNAWFVYPNGQYYISLGETYNLYKRGIIIYPHLYQVEQNYRIAYSRNDFRGHSCTIGSYDGANCYVGTPPTGTTAFMYPNNTGSFYYTPVNGNQCPMSGSWFDGANCYFADIPNSCVGFIWGNKWYVKPDIIY